MKDSSAVCVFDCPSDFRRQAYGLTNFDVKSRLVFQQATTDGEFHTEKRQSVFAFAYFVNRQNIWMVETRSCFGFTAKAHEGVVGFSVMRQNSFQRDDAAGMTLAGAINNPHSAST